jgi:glycosyltransferase involved in cell wall biosynthesis
MPQTITIITPVLNGELTLENCLKSVAKQSYPYKEHWIIDGGSTDKSLAIAKKWAEKYPHIRYISQKDTGIYQAMNKGISLSSGEWLYFMGCDDVLTNDLVLEKLSPYFTGSADLLLGSIIIEGFSKPIVRHSVTSWKRFIFNTILHPGSFYRKTLFDTYKYDETKQIASDYKLNLLLIKNKIPYQILDFVVCTFSLYGKSSRELLMAFKETKQCRSEVLSPFSAWFYNGVANVSFYLKQFLRRMLPHNTMVTIQELKHRHLMQ